MTPPIAPELRKAQKATREVLALSAVLQGVDRALSGDPKLQVKVVHVGIYGPLSGTPAWTDGQTINLNRDRVVEVFQENELPKAILTFKGTNYHELAHVLFTPRKGDEISTWIVKNGYRYKWAWNALEDQRIETLYTALYPPTVPYFRNSTYTWLLDQSFDSDLFYRVYSLLGGRKYVAPELRAKARAAFVDHYGPQVADELDAVVNAYVALPLPGKSDEAIALVVKFHDLLRNTDQQEYLSENGGCGNESTATEGEIDPEKVVEAARRVLENQEQEEQEQGAAGPGDCYPEDLNNAEEAAGGQGEQSEEPGEAGNDDDDDDEKNFGSGSGKTSEGSKGEADRAESKGTDKGTDIDGGETQANDGSSANGASSGAPEAPKPVDLAKDLQDAVADAQADVLTDQGLRDDIDRTIDAFKAQVEGRAQDEEQPEYDRFIEVPAQPGTIATVQKIVASLKTLRTDLEPQWTPERLTGARVNVDHVIRNRADATHLEIFEEWDEGREDEATTEVVIAIDLSMSMANALPQCSEALWALKKSFDNADIRTTVLGFSNGNTVLYKAGEKLRGVNLHRFQAWSGTAPRESLLYAHRLLSGSKATNKVLIVITDGIWSGVKNDGADPENVVKAIRQVGGHTLLFGVNGHSCTQSGTDHGFEQTADIREISDIVKVVRDLVHGIQEKAALR